MLSRQLNSDPALKAEGIRSASGQSCPRHPRLAGWTLLLLLPALKSPSSLQIQSPRSASAASCPARTPMHPNLLQRPAQPGTGASQDPRPSGAGIMDSIHTWDPGASGDQVPRQLRCEACRTSGRRRGVRSPNLPAHRLRPDCPASAPPPRPRLAPLLRNRRCRRVRFPRHPGRLHDTAPAATHSRHRPIASPGPPRRPPANQWEPCDAAVLL